MILHSLIGHLIPVKDTGGPGGFSLGLLKNLRKMFHLPGYLSDIMSIN